MAIKAMDLFEAFTQDKLPKDKAYIISTFIDGNTGYSIYEVISYSGVKSIYPEGQGLTFQSQGKKMHMLLEPSSYPHKGIEPYLRDKSDQIPLRFNELEIFTTKNQVKIMVEKRPIESLSSFTVLKPTGFNVSFVFFDASDIYSTIELFLQKSFNNDGGIPLSDAKKVAKESVKIIQKTMAFKGDFD